MEDFPVISDTDNINKITVKGDKAIVTIYSGSTSYDAIYLGKETDSEELKNSKAIAGIELGASDPDRPEYRVYTFEIPEQKEWTMGKAGFAEPSTVCAENRRCTGYGAD
mgnify:CR=1 FL=1